jgi:hypothetical protein
MKVARFVEVLRYIMKNFPLSSYRIKIMTVERPDKELMQHLEANGFKPMGILVFRRDAPDSQRFHERTRSRRFWKSQVVKKRLQIANKKQ